MDVEQRLAAMGLLLPPPVKVPPGLELPFAFVRVHGNRAYVSGHGPQKPDGSISGPFGQVGAAVSVQEAYQVARGTALSMLGSLKRELGDLDCVTWLRVFGMVNSTPGFDRQPEVINGFSDLILELYGPERGRHARSAIGVAALPFGFCVEIEAEVEIEG